jgi:hypothetical protein
MPKYCRTRLSAIKKGRSLYMTMKPCSRGHLSPRYVVNGRCVECDKFYKAARANSIAVRTPKWADIGEINKLYEESRLLGKDYHVDHEIPLHGDTVSGLHVIDNLKIVPAAVNMRKQNRFDEGLLSC